MKFRVRQRDLRLDNADISELAAIFHILKSLAHRPGVARGIKNHNGQITSQKFTQTGHRFLPRINPILHPQMAGGELNALLAHLHANHLGAGQLRKLHDAQPDWPGAVRRALGGNKVANVIDTVGNRDQHEAMTAFTVRHRIRPVVDVVFDLERIVDAYHCLESGRFFGKVGVNLW